MGIRSSKPSKSSRSSSAVSSSVSSGDLTSALPSAGPVKGYTIADSDFNTEIVKPPPQTCAMIYGDAGEGKSTLALMYAPQPVAYINFDRRGRDAVYAARRARRKILDVEIEHPSDLTRFSNDDAKRLATSALDKTMRHFEIAVRASQVGDVRTICLDTGTELNGVISTAITGSTMAVKGDYGRSKGLINQQWWTLFDMAREGKAHLIVLCRAKEIWHANQPTGRMSFRGPEVIHDAVDWAGWIRLKRNKKKGGARTQKFEIEITKSGVNIAELGEVYEMDDWEDMGGPFVYSCLMQYPGSKMEDWK